MRHFQSTGVAKRLGCAQFRTHSIQPALGYVSILGLLVEFQDLKIELAVVPWSEGMDLFLWMYVHEYNAMTFNTNAVE